MKNDNEIFIWTDGACSGNPGPGGWGVLIKNKNLSQNISHFAFSILILSIIFNGILSKEYSGNMKVGDEVNFNTEF